jgi:hypothetical protein
MNHPSAMTTPINRMSDEPPRSVSTSKEDGLSPPMAGLHEGTYVSLCQIFKARACHET